MNLPAIDNSHRKPRDTGYEYPFSHRRRTNLLGWHEAQGWPRQSCRAASSGRYQRHRQSPSTRLLPDRCRRGEILYIIKLPDILVVGFVDYLERIGWDGVGWGINEMGRISKVWFWFGIDPSQEPDLFP